MGAIKRYFFDIFTKHYCDFKECAQRRELLCFAFLWGIFVLILMFLLSAGGLELKGCLIVFGVIAIFSVLPFWSLVVRRLHDAGFSSRWLLLLLLGPIGALVILIYLFIPSYYLSRFKGNTDMSSGDKAIQLILISAVAIFSALFVYFSDKPPYSLQQNSLIREANERIVSSVAAFYQERIPHIPKSTFQINWPENRDRFIDNIRRKWKSLTAFNQSSSPIKKAGLDEQAAIETVVNAPIAQNVEIAVAKGEELPAWINRTRDIQPVPQVQAQERRSTPQVIVEVETVKEVRPAPQQIQPAPQGQVQERQPAPQTIVGTIIDEFIDTPQGVKTVEIKEAVKIEPQAPQPQKVIWSTKNGQAQYMLGRMYYKGTGSVQNIDEALKWFLFAADEGNVEGYEMAQLIILRASKNLPSDISLINVLADNGDLDAKFVRAIMTDLGEGTAQDKDKAKVLFREAFDGYYVDAKDIVNARSQVKTGDMFFWGLGVKADQMVAGRFYKTAALLRNTEALYNLGKMSEFGLGDIPKNLDEALRLYSRAAAQGSFLAQKRLGLLDDLWVADIDAKIRFINMD
ncbi:MAG: DUF805 domain-containing protein [Elusimicrobiota bacterium]|jgi:uncharacterized membrane protein YhaH (DUF805 family)|nr:DUF805 domain-containing protein [Elusimicrobiota bacterium]